MKISIVVAASLNSVIGKDGKIPWPPIKEDLKHFRKITEEHYILMGRKTFESIGKPLPKRTNLVLTNSKDFRSEGVIVFNNFDEALSYARENGENELMIIGGEQIYNIAQPIADRIYLTRIQKEFDGDTKFNLLGGWKTMQIEDHFDAEIPYQFLKLERK